MRVAQLLLAAQAARALVDVEWYCYEASNVVNASLADLSVAGGVNFTYYPVNHVNATSGAFECAVDGESLDCESTAARGPGPRRRGALAAEFAASKAAFPVHFATDDDALPPGDPSYVDVRAATRASCAVADATATCSYEVLGAFRGAVDQACRDGGFEAGLVYGLRHAAGLDADVAVRAC
ncbi:hypothetical protein JL720_13218 [Aureococcus anophagefferens]|nr:hypothetical protein JL720_13218 [Aureococcus anophagefferens]